MHKFRNRSAKPIVFSCELLFAVVSIDVTVNGQERLERSTQAYYSAAVLKNQRKNKLYTAASHRRIRLPASVCVCVCVCACVCTHGSCQVAT